MRTRIDEQLLRQVDRYRLRYCCDCCGYFDTAAGECALGYPAEPRRSEALRIDRTLEFCKEFELA